MLQNMKAALGLLIFLLGTRCALAQADYVVNEPFTATETHTVTRAGKIAIETLTLARASDGSIYRAYSTTGSPAYRASIDDVPNQRIIRLDLKKQTYSILAQVDLTTKTADDVENAIRARRDESRERRSLGLGVEGKENHSDLGVQVEDGVTLYGWAVDRITLRPPLRGRPQSDIILHSETWTTDFGVNMTYESAQYDVDRPDDPKTEIREEDVVTDLQRGEPDQSLFRTPEGFAPEGVTPQPARHRRRK
jgi:hypothetical protein